MVVAKVVAKYPNTHRTAPRQGRVRVRGSGTGQEGDEQFEQ